MSDRVINAFDLPSSVTQQYHDYCDEHFVGLRQRESMPTPNRAAKREAERVRPGSAPEQPKRGRPNTPQTPAVEREIRELQEALDAQIKQRDGYQRSIDTKTAALKKTVESIEKKAIERKQVLRQMNGVEESMEKKIK